MKSMAVGLVLGLGLLASGCGALDQYREGPQPVAQPAQAPVQEVAPQAPATDLAPPSASPPDPSQLPPYWYWSDKEQQQFYRYLQQQWQFYCQNKQPPPQFTRPPVCTSTLLGGQVLTTCR